MKRSLVVFTIAIVFILSGLTPVPPVAADSNAIETSSELVHLEGGLLVQGQTMVPLRSIFESLNAVVKWDDGTQRIVASKDETAIMLQVNRKEISVNGQTQTLAVPPQLINGTTMVPVRFISESLGAKVEWDPTVQTAIISLDGKVIRVKVTTEVVPKQPTNTGHYISPTDYYVEAYEEYFYNTKARSLYYYNEDKDSFIPLGELNVFGTNGVKVNNSLYFPWRMGGENLSDQPTYLYKMDLYGKNKTPITDFEPYNRELTTDGTSLFYLRHINDGEIRRLEKMDLNGKNQTVLYILSDYESIENIRFINGYLYYIQRGMDISPTDGRARSYLDIFRMTTDGKNKEKLNRYEQKFTRGANRVEPKWLGYQFATVDIESGTYFIFDARTHKGNVYSIPEENAWGISHLLGIVNGHLYYSYDSTSTTGKYLIKKTKIGSSSSTTLTELEEGMTIYDITDNHIIFMLNDRTKPTLVKVKN